MLTLVDPNNNSIVWNDSGKSGGRGLKRCGRGLRFGRCGFVGGRLGFVGAG